MSIVCCCAIIMWNIWHIPSFLPTSNLLAAYNEMLVGSLGADTSIYPFIENSCLTWLEHNFLIALIIKLNLQSDVI